jgi:hypothetical protein
VTPRLPVLLALALAAVVPATTQAPATAKQTRHHAEAAAAGDTQVTTARRKRRRPGCGKFCRQAGGFGGPPPGTPVPVVITPQELTVGSDGIVGVRARCALRKTCRGAILLDGQVAYGRANLRIPARKTRTVLVYVPKAGRQYLAKHKVDREVYATVPLKSDDPVSVSRRLRLLPHS